MPLSKETTDRIRKEAIKHSCISEPYSATSYEAGATAWAVWKQKAEGYEKALKKIIKTINSSGINSGLICQMVDKIATKTIEQFK